MTNRSAEPLLEHLTKLGIAFIPWFPNANGKLAASGGPLEVAPGADVGQAPVGDGLCSPIHAC